MFWILTQTNASKTYVWMIIQLCISQFTCCNDNPHIWVFLSPIHNKALIKIYRIRCLYNSIYLAPYFLGENGLCKGLSAWSPPMGLLLANRIVLLRAAFGCRVDPFTQQSAIIMNYYSNYKWKSFIFDEYVLY